MRVALAQINPTLGDFAGNAKKIIEFSKRARSKRADVVVFSELALFGYPPNDLLERADLVSREIPFIKKIVAGLPKDITAVFGAIILNPRTKKGGRSFLNAAIVAHRGKPIQFTAKQLLPSYDVFDETRFFEPGSKTGVFNLSRGQGKIAVSICEDMWGDMVRDGHRLYARNPLRGWGRADLMINISSSPFSKKKMAERLAVARAHVKQMKIPFVYVNQLGGQDELIFDGRAFILDEKGKLIVQAPSCEEDLVIIDLGSHLAEHRPEDESDVETLRRALVLGIRDFVAKTGQKQVHLGLSGGVDSALTAALAVDALGPSHVTGILLPGPFSSSGSVDDSKKLASNLGIKALEINISDLYEDARKTVGFMAEKNSTDPIGQREAKDAAQGSGRASGDGRGVTLTEQNLQARLRGLVLMAFSNQRGSMLLSTSNKSELATGYSTLYGDTCGGLMPLGDLLKHEIYKLAEHYNGARELIPEEILMKAPSAELAPGQVDQDSLPPYPVLDKAVEKIVEQRRAPSSKIEKWLAEQIKKSEFKRWQAPPILKVSEHAFGRGRRMPIARKGE